MQNLLKNGGFQDGILDPWIASNTYIKSNIAGAFRVFLTGKKGNSSIEQTIRVMPGSNYDLSITASASKWGISPPVKVVLEYLDLSGQYIQDGINFTIRKAQLANWNSGNKRSFKTFQETSLEAPANAYWAKLTIMKINLRYTTNIIIDNIALTEVATETSLPTEYIETIDTNTAPIIETDLGTIAVGQETVSKMQLPQNSKFIYIVNKDKMVSVIHSSTNTVIETIDFSGNFSYQENQNIIVSSDGSTPYTTNQSSSTSQDHFTMIDTLDNSLVTTLELEGESVTLTLTKDTQSDCNLLYVINHNSLSVSVIDASTNTLIDSFDLDQEP